MIGGLTIVNQILRVSAPTAVDLDCGYAAIHRTAKSQSRGEKPHFHIFKFLNSFLRVLRGKSRLRRSRNPTHRQGTETQRATSFSNFQINQFSNFLLTSFSNFQIFKFPNSPLSIFPTHQRPGTKLTPERWLRGRKHMHGIQR